MSVDLLEELVAGTLLAGLVQWLVTHLAYWPATRARVELHWTERARRTWNARLLTVKGPVILIGISLVFAGRDLHGREAALRAVALPVCMCLGALVGGLPIARRTLGRPIRLRDLLREYAISFLVLSPGITVLLVMMLLLLPRKLGATSIGIMAGGLVLAVALTLGLAVPALRALGLLAPAPSRLLEIVRQAAEAAQIPAPPTYLLRWYQANAVAFPFARLLAFTEPALEVLSDEELRAVARHEIAHLQESTRTKVTRLSGILLIFPLFTIPVWSKTFGLPGIVLPLAIYVAAGRLFRGLNQRMERAADKAACSGEEASNAGCYAEALEKIYRYNVVPAVMRSRSHPHLYDRLAAAGITPEYPRPKAPSSWLFAITAVTLAAGTMVPLEFLRYSKGPSRPYRPQRFFAPARR